MRYKTQFKIQKQILM